MHVFVSSESNGVRGLCPENPRRQNARSQIQKTQKRKNVSRVDGNFSQTPDCHKSIKIKNKYNIEKNKGV